MCVLQMRVRYKTCKVVRETYCRLVKDAKYNVSVELAIPIISATIVQNKSRMLLFIGLRIHRRRAASFNQDRTRLEYLYMLYLLLSSDRSAFCAMLRRIFDLLIS